MPGPLLVAGVTAGANLLGQGINALSQGNMNRKNRQFAERMTYLQRQWALQDWERQNEYNSPLAQMTRLKQAGLNPNLVYGNGANAEAPPIRSSQVENWRGEAPQFDLGSVAGDMISTLYDVQLKKQTVDNLKAQNAVAVQEALLKAAQVVATSASAERTKVGTKSAEFDLGLKTELKQTTLEAAAAQVKKLLADTQSTTDANTRANQMQPLAIENALQDIATKKLQRRATLQQMAKVRQEISNLEKDGVLKAFDVKLTEQGIRPGDPLWNRYLNQLLNFIMGKLGMESDEPSGESMWRRRGDSTWRDTPFK